jgi:hypothetical protein
MVNDMIHPIALDSLAVFIAAPLTNSLTVDEQAVVGAFFSVLGDLLSLNSSYLSIYQVNTSNDDSSDDEYDLIKESIEKIKKELENIKKEDLN